MILTAGRGTIFHGLAVFGIGLVEVREGTECSAVLVDLAVLPFLERAAEHQSNYCSRQQLTSFHSQSKMQQLTTSHQSWLFTLWMFLSFAGCVGDGFDGCIIDGQRVPNEAGPRFPPVVLLNSHALAPRSLSHLHLPQPAHDLPPSPRTRNHPLSTLPPLPADPGPAVPAPPLPLRLQDRAGHQLLTLRRVPAPR